MSVPRAATVPGDPARGWLERPSLRANTKLANALDALGRRDESLPSTSQIRWPWAHVSIWRAPAKESGRIGEDRTMAACRHQRPARSFAMTFTPARAPKRQQVRREAVAPHSLARNVLMGLAARPDRRAPLLTKSGQPSGSVTACDAPLVHLMQVHDLIGDGPFLVIGDAVPVRIGHSGLEQVFQFRAFLAQPFDRVRTSQLPHLA